MSTGAPSKLMQFQRVRRYAVILAAIFTLLLSLCTVTSAFGNAAITKGMVGVNAVTARLPELRDRVFDGVQDTGFQAIRLHVEWPLIEPLPGYYTWESTDTQIDEAVNRGLSVLGVITYTPAWAATPDGRKYIHPYPADPAVFADFVRKAAERYRGSILYWEIWNEPNVETHWAPAPNVDVYADMLKRSYTVLKQVDPANFVITGGLSPTIDTETKISPDSFVTQLYAKGAAKSFDAIAMHPYSTPNLLSSGGASWTSNSDVHQVTAIMRRNRQGGKRLWFTEFGAPTMTGHEFGVTAQRQSEILVDGIKFMRALPNGGPIFIFDYQDIETGSSDVEMSYGLVRSDFTPKPSYSEVRSLIGRKPS